MTTDAQPAVAYRVTGRITTRTARGLRVGLTVLASSRALARQRADRYLTTTRGSFRWDQSPNIKLGGSMSYERGLNPTWAALRNLQEAPSRLAKTKPTSDHVGTYQAIQLTAPMISSALAAYGVKPGDWILRHGEETQFIPKSIFPQLYNCEEITKELPNDDAIIAYLRNQPRRSLRQICDHFDLRWAYSLIMPGPNGETYGYSVEAKRLALTLQRLRKQRRIYQEGQRWFARGNLIEKDRT